MKANKAPEKIWMDSEWIPHFDCKDCITENSVEYTRTDAFIEKACDWLADNARAFDEGDIYNAEDLIEHFRKYMKGE